MTTTTPSLTRKNQTSARRRGFTLVELMVGAGLSAFILAGTISTFLFLGRSGANIQNYSDMESQSRKALEVFAEDVRQASAITWTSATQVTLTVNSAAVVYIYSSTDATFSRVDATSNRALITGITASTFTFRAYNLSGTLLPLGTASERSAANTNTKQLQISLECTRTNQTVVAATNAVLSARFILRNKIVTA